MIYPHEYGLLFRLAIRGWTRVSDLRHRLEDGKQMGPALMSMRARGLVMSRSTGVYLEWNATDAGRAIVYADERSRP